MSISLEKYAKQLQIKQFFKRLGASSPEILAKEVEHFTTKEAKKRDEIVINYFGQSGVDRIANTVTELLYAFPRLQANAKVLDVGAGTGFFTIKIAKKVHGKFPKVSFYAMDITPAMLISLEKKKPKITPFIGIAENITRSIDQARRYFNIPHKFDAIISTLTLHHSTQPEKVFKSLKEALKKKGKVIVARARALEFKKEMGDVHLGFKPRNVYKMAKKHFSEVTVQKMPGICCECSGRSAEIFAAFMHDYS